MEDKLMGGLDIVTFLKSEVELFQGFPIDRLEELVEGSSVTTFEPNEAIIVFGAEGDFMGVILEGSAEASVTDDSGQTHRISSLKTGDIFGEMSLMTGDRTTADVIGTTRCKVLLIPQDLFSRILIAHPPAIRYLSKTISERMRVLARERTMLDLEATALRRSDDPYGLNLKTDAPEVLLVVNCGSSSLKYGLFNTDDERRNTRGVIERIGQKGTRHTCWLPGEEMTRELPPGGHKEAFASMVEMLTDERNGVIDSPYAITAVGHRVVHGGDRFTNSVIISDEVIEEIEQVSDLAPLHNPVNLVGIKEARRCFEVAHHVAVFDTSFHHTLPPYAYLYGLPFKYYKQNRIRRYGFHGVSHLYASLKAAQYLKRPFNELRIISCHLGNGASMCAVDHGRSIDTSMGLTPTQGLLMGTRCGDVDPAALIHLMRTEDLSPDDLDTMINRESGLLGLSGVSNDMRDIEKAAREGHHQALLAFKTFCYQIRKYIGAYVAAMQGLDVVIFTGGIGQGSAGVRSLACQGLGYMGIHIDEYTNRNVDGFEQVCHISAADAPVSVLVVPSDEERMIARETLRALRASNITNIIRSQENVPVPLEVSAHHVHLSLEHVEALFGAGYRLNPELELSQPGQFACRERVTLIGPKGRVERVRVLGPTRKETQVEISMTEQFELGIDPPIRESGDLENTPGIAIEGPRGVVNTDKGVICALRHIHMAPEDALRFGLRDKYKVHVRVRSGRELVFGDVLIRVHPSYGLAMHLDTDEANAAGIGTGITGYIDGIQSRS
jgi:acetate kinase